MVLDRRNTDGAVEQNGTIRIKVIGVGGGGVNVIRRMAKSPVPGVELVCVNTDRASLDGVSGVRAITLGQRLTRGLGSGGNPDIGKRAAEEARDEIAAEVRDVDLVFIAAGLGGGTGTGATPVVAAIAQECGALTMAVVTTPFRFEGTRRRTAALRGLQPLREHIDTLVVLNNDYLLANIPKNTPVKVAFQMADQVLVRSILGVSQVINLPAEINIDFADVRAVMQNGGRGILGIARAEGSQRVLRATKEALKNPLMDVGAEGAKEVLFMINGGPDVTLNEVTEAGTYLAGLADPHAHIFFGLHTDEGRKRPEEVEVIVIATHLPGAAYDPAVASNDMLQRLRSTVPLFEAHPNVPSFPRKSWLPSADPSQLLGDLLPDWEKYGRENRS